MILGFWGLTVLPEKTYTQIVDNSFKLSMAALDEECKPGRSSIRVTVDNKTFILCSLIAGQIEQQNLDLVFTEGEEITFSVSGDNAVHLSGNFLPEDVGGVDSEEDEEEEDEEDDEGETGVIVKRIERLESILGADGGEDDDDSEDDPDFTANDDTDDDDDDEDDNSDNNNEQDGDDDGDESEDESEDEDDEDDKEEEIEKKKSALTSKRPAESETPVSKKQKVTEDKAVPVKAKVEPKKEEAKKKENPKAKEDANKEEAKKKKDIKTLPSGLIIEDVKPGDGPRAKSGKKIGMRYIGRLENGKVFDKNVSGKPFFFHLGRGEVIKGWDLGIQGMQLGGERHLTIPPALAYGAQGAPPDIPRNATLKFEVKLVTLK
ncbi:MAG: hypothetical protein J3Q66DRAFT_314478 [Benniella sp.]|nr:MAG: hypothetical protein J3Q66DRAFT_314478 [Benniella sp.]